MKIDLPKIEKKWQKRWEKSRLYEVKDEVLGKENFYHLVMFPYPSGDLHIGHWYNFGPADTYARFKRMQGFNVLSPIGFDAFGLPAENAAIKRKLHPAKWTFDNIEAMRAQIKRMGTMYDWSREVITCQPEYYKWTQWMFLQLFKAGLAKRKKIYANWCPKDKTVLANEQVIEGRCERCESEVVQKQIEQWVFLITRYAKRLLEDVDALDWPERTKTMQRNWIGESQGAEIEFRIKNKELGIKVFTTRPDTIFGVTYLVVAPEHELLKYNGLEIENYEKVQEYRYAASKKTPLQRQAEQKEKTGIELKGIQAINPATGKEIPIWVADYVLGGYGTGAIMAVPAHDERDFIFAKKFNLPIMRVVSDEGKLIHSGKFSGMKSQEAIPQMTKEFGAPDVQYKMRDWIVSRQRYWGCPIPILYCPSCGVVPVPENDLPVLLPELKNFEPTGTGKSPLAKSEEFVKTKCPKCGGSAERETDTIDTFVDSSWYFLRYVDPKNSNEFASKEKMNAWLPVSIYIGGAEHSILHLLYARFFTKALQDMGYVWFSEPFTKLRHQGIILGPDGQKMSKSRGNVIDPDALVLEYGTDVVRMYLMFMGPYNAGGLWNPGGINGMAKFLERIYRLKSKSQNPNHKIEKTIHKTIKKVGEDLEELKFNTAISTLMVLVNEIQTSGATKKDYETLVKLLAPFAPHLSEELWAKLGHKESVHKEEFPKFDEELVSDERVTIVVQINGKVRVRLEVASDAQEDEIRAMAEKQLKIWLADKKIKKTIFIKNRLLNFVI